MNTSASAGRRSLDSFSDPSAAARAAAATCFPSGARSPGDPCHEALRPCGSWSCGPVRRPVSAVETRLPRLRGSATDGISLPGGLSSALESSASASLVRSRERERHDRPWDSESAAVSRPREVAGDGGRDPGNAIVVVGGARGDVRCHVCVGLPPANVEPEGDKLALATAWCECTWEERAAAAAARCDCKDGRIAAGKRCDRGLSATRRRRAWLPRG